VNGLHDGEIETATEMLEAIRARAVRAEDLVDRSLRRAEEWQPSINAFSQLWAEGALSAARDRPGPPLAVKDLFDVAGLETTGCSLLYRGRRATADAPVVAAVKSATVLVGKTNQHELAAGGTNLVSSCGRTGNPWDPGRMTGGSSGGSAAAVAAGVVPWALGSDTGGSIRIPSSMCGTFGLKPTTGRFSIDGMLPLAPSMDCPGPIAATAADLALLFELMGGGPVAGREGVRIGVPDGYFGESVHDEVKECVRRASVLFGQMGVPVEEVDGRGIEEARRLWMRVCSPEFADAHPSAFERPDLVAPTVMAWLEMGARMSLEERMAARRGRADVARWFRERLQEVDVLLIPTTPYPAPGAEQDEVDLGSGRTVNVNHVGPGWITCTVNLANLPAVALPAGWSGEGMPIGVTLVGRPNEDGLLLALAARWEEAAGYRPRRPHSRT
jgi:aspartyl-tRNA(Asn)/glutamyl-tRNA(Gln) amidotransferase subunit A